MQTAGIVPDGALYPKELIRLYQGQGPLATVYLGTEAKAPQAAQLSARRWSAAREALAGDGAPVAVLEAIDPVIEDAHLHGEGVAVVAGETGVLHVEHLAQAPTTDRGWWEGLPVLIPVLHQREEHPGYLMVLVDREGADLHAVSATGGARSESSRGSDYPLAKTSRGWSALHHQRRAEGTWAANARQVASDAERLAEEVGAVQIVAAGDERSLSLLGEALSEGWRARFHRVAGGTGHLEHEARRWAADAAARQTVAMVEELRQHLGERRRAVEGAEATVDALRQGKVAALLVTDQPDDDRRAWFSEGQGDISLRASTDFPAEARLPDVLVRAAFQTGAGVRVVPAAGGPREGAGALLRWE